MTLETFYSDTDRPGLVDIARYPYPGAMLPSSYRLSPDGKRVTYLHSHTGDMKNSLWSQDIDSGQSKLLWDVSGEEMAREKESLEEALLKERLRQRSSGITSYQRIGKSTSLLVSFERNLHIIDEQSGERRALTSGKSPCLDPKSSPDGKTVAFVRDGELWTVPTAGGNATQKTSGEAGTTRGVADYIAQEEMGRNSGYFWSQDGQHIAILEADERHIERYPIVHQGKDRVVVEHHHYPFAGAENPKVRLGVIESTGGEPTWFDLNGHYGEEIYIPRVHWFPDGHLGVQVQNRDQTWLELLDINLATGDFKALIRDEQPEAWINLHNGFSALKKGGQFLWMSESSGFFHLSLHERDGRKVRDLTGGEWMVTRIVKVEEAKRNLYFMGTKESALERHLYRVSLDGSEPTKITEESGWHSVTLQSNQRSFLDTFSSLTLAPKVYLRSLDGEATKTLADSESHDLRPKKLTPPELLTIKNRHGNTLYGAFYRAADDGGQAKPLLVHVYGGPHAQRVLNAWATTVDMRAQYWSTQGFHVLRLDNRGSANRGLAFELPLRHKTGVVEVEDQVDGVKHLIAEGLVDKDRVGVAGWSYGGYMACMCLINAPDVFKAGVSGAPVTHWDGYDTHYTERYMGLPQKNVSGYKESSVLDQVQKMNGALMLIHGLIDENVHFRHTARLINALIAADKDYDLVLFPDERHMPRNESGRLYMERRMLDFFKRHFV